MLEWDMGTKRKNEAAAKLARLRAKKLTPERRSEIAKKASTARWAKKAREDLR
jgi:hypothetical protein